MLDFQDRKSVPTWCCITERGWLETPSFNRIWIPRDAQRSLDIFWDGLRCRAAYYTWDYGEVYLYEGRTLPQNGERWKRTRYTPAVELEVRVVALASRGIDFKQLEARIHRPRMEIAAIMNWHGYNGWACTIHNGCRTELLYPAGEERAYA